MYWGNAFWETKYLVKLAQAPDLQAMEKVAMEVLDEIPDPIEKLCGPMTTGGINKANNMKRFEAVIKGLTSDGHKVFDQIPFQKALERYCYEHDIEYDLKILASFYLPIFKSGKIECFKFIPGWQSSRGASWAHDQAKQLNIKIEYLSSEQVSGYL